MQTQSAQLSDTLHEVIQYIYRNVFVVGEALHRSRCAAHVHQDIGHLQSRHRAEHIAVELSAGNIVDDGCPILFYAHLRHIGTEGIHRYRHVRKLIPQYFQCRAQSLHFLLCRYVIRIRT